MKSKFRYFTAAEYFLWGASVALVLGAFWLFDRSSYLTLAASLVGVTSLIFAAKGNPVGPALMVLFSILYGIISFGFSYWGEMLTYLGMTLPMSVVSLWTWLRHPFRGRRSEVAVSRLTGKDYALMSGLTVGVTILFFWILKMLGTANLYPSTLSVTTSFAAVYLTAKRSSFFALAYAANDIVLVVLWVMASLSDARYVSVVVCFSVFFLNDLYGFVRWKRMEACQRS